MLDEDVQLVLNLEQRRLSGPCKHFDHVSQLRMEKLHGVCCSLTRGYLEFNSSLVSDLLCAPGELLGVQVIVLHKQGLRDAQLAGKARDHPLDLDLVRLDSLFAGRIVHVNVHLDLLTGRVSMLFQ